MNNPLKYTDPTGYYIDEEMRDFYQWEREFEFNAITNSFHQGEFNGDANEVQTEGNIGMAEWYSDAEYLIDDYVFNEKGKFVRKDENNDLDKIVLENSITGERAEYSLHDTEKYKANLEFLLNEYEPEDIQLLFFKDRNDIAGYVEHSGVLTEKAQKNPIYYAFRHSQGKRKNDIWRIGKMDTWGTVLGHEMLNAGIKYGHILDDNGGFYIYTGGDNKAYNAMDFGNAVWGKEMSLLGFSLETSLKAADLHHFMLGRRQGGTWDSKADQKAIEDGFLRFHTGGVGVNW